MSGRYRWNPGCPVSNGVPRVYLRWTAVAHRRCPPYGHDAKLPLQLTGVRDGAIIKRLPGAAEATLPLQSSGGAGERWWFLNGEPLTERGRNVTLHLTDKGDYQLLVMDDVGQIATVKFVMQ